jgi:uncharacterized protein (TIGR00297 family)
MSRARHNKMPVPLSTAAWIQGACVATYLSRRARTNKSLSSDGAIAGGVVACFIVATGYRGYLLFVFYLLGSYATKFRHSIKQPYDATIPTNISHSQGNRTAYQVLSCSIIAVILSLLQAIWYKEMRPIDFVHYPEASKLTAAILAHHATCMADTFASELGMAWPRKPILVIQPWRIVPIGTNGGITVIGTLWSAMGGAMMGMALIAADRISGYGPPQYYNDGGLSTILFSTLMGLMGSFIDSILGSTLQATYYDQKKQMVYHEPGIQRTHISGYNLLDNVQVNFISVGITTYLAGWIIAPWFFSSDIGSL